METSEVKLMTKDALRLIDWKDSVLNRARASWARFDSWTHEIFFLSFFRFFTSLREVFKCHPLNMYVEYWFIS